MRIVSRGARKLYHSSTQYLAEYGDSYEGVDVKKLVSELTACCREVIDSEEEIPKCEIVVDLIPEIHLNHQQAES